MIEETWSVSMERCRSFFSSQPETECRAAGFSFREASITLTKMAPGRFGESLLPRTQLRIEGPESDVKAIHRRFFLQFLSAGG